MGENHRKVQQKSLEDPRHDQRREEFGDNYLLARSFIEEVIYRRKRLKSGLGNALTRIPRQSNGGYKPNDRSEIAATLLINHFLDQIKRELPRITETHLIDRTMDLLIEKKLVGELVDRMGGITYS